MRAPFCRVCGVFLSVLSVSGCALIDSYTSDGTSAQATSPTPEAKAAPPDVVKAPVETFSAADLEAIDNPDIETVRGVQAALNEAGFPVGRPDGKVGKRTLHGMRLFKVARRMPVNNEITPALLTALAVSQD